MGVAVGEGSKLGRGPKQEVGVLLQFTGQRPCGRGSRNPVQGSVACHTMTRAPMLTLHSGECGLNPVSYQREGLGAGHKTATHSQNPFLPVTEAIKSKTSDYCKGCRDKLLEQSLINSS